MKRLILFVLFCLLVLCACQNTLDYRHSSLNKVNGAVLFNRNVLESGGDYAIGYANGNIRSDRITLTWHTCTDRDFLSYRLFRGNAMVRAFDSANQTSFTDSLLTENTFYQYRLLTTVESGMAVQDTLLLKTPRFEPPSNLAYTYFTSTMLRLTWTNNAESATSFVVEKIAASQPNNVETFTTVVNSFVDGNVVAGASYSYRVKAVSPYESTGWSSVFSFTFIYTMNPPVLSSITQLFPGTDVKLAWLDQSTGETGFRIFRAVGVASVFTQIDSVGDNVTQYVDTSLKNFGFFYRYFVQAYNSTESWDSNTRAITIEDLNITLYDFESTDGGFESNSVTGWDWGISANFGAHSGNRDWGAPLTGVYGNNVAYKLVSPSVPIPANGSLRFYQKYAFENNYDGGNVKISTDDGLSWQLLIPQGGYTTDNVYSSNEPGYTGDQFFWAQPTFDLSAYAGQTVKFRWNLTSDSSVTDEGWTIDDVVISNQFTTVSLW